MRNCLKHLLLFWVLIFSTDIAMAQYVTIGAANGTTAYLMRTFREDGKSQLTFSNNDLISGANTLNVGDTIYSIGWNVQSVGGQAMYNANINIIESGSATSVWSGTLVPTLGWNDILLDVPYVRTGTGNLIVEYCFDNCDQTSTTDVYRTQTPTTTFNYKTGNNANGCIYTPNTNTVNRPNTRFGLLVLGATYSQDTICLGTSLALSSSSSITLNTNISGFTYEGIHNGNHYFLSTLNKIWLEADLSCRQNGGHLAHIANTSENNYIKNNVINSTSWIGYHQNCNSGLFSEPSGGWEWTDGTLASYTNWNNNEPNDYYGTNSENWVEMRADGKWNDHIKTRIIPYVMEIEETYLWNTAATTSSITVNPTTTTTYWVDHSFGTNTEREYFNVVIGIEGCTDPAACNYDSLATCDDGLCLTVYGCTDPTACNYDPLATCDDGSCVYDVSIVTATNVCTGVCDGEVSVAVSPITPSISYTYTIDGGSVTTYLTNTNGLCAGNHSYEFFIDGSSCGVETIIISEYPAMTLQTTVVDANCDSSYAFVSASVASSSGGNVSTLTYCASSTGDNDYSTIDLVSIIGDGNSIVNNTVGICDQYEDYTNLYTTLTPGQSYFVDVDLGTCNWNGLAGAGQYHIDSAKVFIDWNIDGDFTDPGEMVGVFGGVQSPTTNTISFIVPNGNYGATRMRVVSQAQENNVLYPDGPVGPCDVGTYSGSYLQPWYGATEDYSIFISTPTTLTNANYQWYSGAGSTTPIIGETDSITNSLSAGTYTVIVTDDNGCEASETVSVGQSFQVQLDSLIAAPNPACFGDTVTLAAYPSSPQYEYKFMYNTGAGWNNVTIPGWDINNPVIYNNITLQTQFRAKVRSSIDNSCTTAWETIIVPVIIIPTSGPIWHN
ncbi:C-type lectin domain-containing protein [Flavobacteriales bacterium]|nr:C-type lectin domain-containing protein [Flavobacteriales bacterium]